MHLIARLDESTLRALLDELLPVTILLDEGGKDGSWIAIDPPQKVDFVAGEGLHLITGGRIRWMAAGVPVEATLHSARVLLKPEIAPDKHGGKLVFHPSLLDADLKYVPGLLDRGITALVNRQLEARSNQIAWDFGRTLALSVPLPPALVGVQALQLSVPNGNVTVTDHAIELTLQLSIHFLRTPQTAGTGSTV